MLPTLPQVVPLKWVVVKEYKMKLLEVAPDFVKSQAGILMTVLQHLEGKTEPGTKVPMSSISQIMLNMGYGFNFDDFKSLYDSSPALQELVSDFNRESITIGRDNNDIVGPEPDAEKQASTVDQMASRAASL
jgi:hypothetical protein